MQLSCDTLEEALKHMSNFRKWQPYKYGGKWYLGLISGEIFAYRSKQSLKNKAIKMGIESFEMWEIN